MPWVDKTVKLWDNKDYPLGAEARYALTGSQLRWLFVSGFLVGLSVTIAVGSLFVN